MEQSGFTTPACIGNSGMRFDWGAMVIPGDRIVAARTGGGGGGEDGARISWIPGPGTYIRQGYIYAALVGRLQRYHEPTPIGHNAKEPSAATSRAIVLTVVPQTDTNGRSSTAVSVTTATSSITNTLRASQYVIRVGQIVLCRIVRIQLPQAQAEIVALEGVGQLPHFHEAILRREDISGNATVMSQAGGVPTSSTSGNDSAIGCATAPPTTANVSLINVKDAFRPGDLVVAKVLALGDTRRYMLTTAEPGLGVIYGTSKVGNTLRVVNWKEMEDSTTGVRESRKCARPPRKVGLTRTIDTACEEMVH